MQLSSVEGQEVHQARPQLLGIELPASIGKEIKILFPTHFIGVKTVVHGWQHSVLILLSLELIDNNNGHIDMP